MSSNHDDDDNNEGDDHALHNEQDVQQDQYHDDLDHHDNHGDADDNNNADDDDNDTTALFPTLPAFTVPVEIRPTPWLGPNQYGVFATRDIPPHTKFWKWTNRVVQFHYTELDDYIRRTYPNDTSDNNDDDPDDVDGTINSGTNVENIRCFLRRGFVLPAPYDEYWNSNPTDAGCYMNHYDPTVSTQPNCVQPYGTIRWVRAGEELTMDYSQNGNPQWYIDICHRYGMMTAREIAEQCNNNNNNNNKENKVL